MKKLTIYFDQKFTPYVSLEKSFNNPSEIYDFLNTVNNGGVLITDVSEGKIHVCPKHSIVRFEIIEITEPINSQYLIEAVS